MRLLVELENPDRAKSFSNYLKSLTIDHDLEVVKITDWGNPAYGHQTYKIWIEDEDKFNDAVEAWNHFQETPDDPKFKTPPPPRLNPFKPNKLKERAQNIPSPLTNFIVGFCIFVFFLSQFMFVSPKQEKIQLYDYVPSPIEKVMLFDYPKQAEKLTHVVDEYGLEDWPPEAFILKKEALATPMWEGLYDPLTKYLKGDKSVNFFYAPLFERISQGEIWRFITPIFLHANLIHILFNMLVFLVLGKEVERMIGIKRTLLIIFLSAIFSDTMQYMMSGFRFMGISGVICALLSFIVTRQKLAPWEGYRLERSSVYFMLSFIFLMAALSLITLITDYFGHEIMATSVANTAHLSGLFIGWVLGRIPYFQWKG